MSWWVAILVLAMGFAAAHVGWGWFTRYFHGGVDDPQNFDAAAIMVLFGCSVIAIAFLGLVYALLWLLGWA